MSTKALEWIERVADEFGTESEAGRVRIPHSQAALAGATGIVEGTVTYYMRHLKPEVVTQESGCLIVDIAALVEQRRTREQRRRRTAIKSELAGKLGRMTADGTAIELGGDDKTPSVRVMAKTVGVSPGTMQRHLRDLEDTGHIRRSGRSLEVTAGDDPFPTDAVAPVNELLAIVRSLTAVTEQLTTLATTLVSRELQTPRTFADDPANKCAHPAKFAGSEEEITSVFPKKDRKILSFSSNKTPRTNARGPRTSQDFAGRLSDQEIDKIVEPLERLCEKATEVGATHIDDRARQVLSTLTADELSVGVASAIRLLKSGHARSPLGLLVSKALGDDQRFFSRSQTTTTAPPPSTSPDTEPDIDLAAAAAVVAMSKAELADLDSRIAASTTPEGFARLTRSERRLAAERRMAWREREDQRVNEAQNG